MRLSDVQIAALHALREHGAMQDFHAIVFIGKSRKQTLRSLQRLGLVRYYPTPQHWKLTPDGKAWLNDEDARRMLAEKAAKDAAVVRDWQESAP